MKHPLIVEPSLCQTEISLMGKIVERPMQDSDVTAVRDFQRAVGAARIHYSNIIAPLEGIQATPQIRSLIERQKQDRDLHVARGSGRFPIVVAGLPATIVQSPISRIATTRAPTAANAPILTPGFT